MFRLFQLGVAVAMVMVATQAWAEDEEAGADISERSTRSGKTLAERVPAVSGRFFRKEGRVSLAPAIGLTLNDPFYNSLPGGLSVTYHILESLAVGVSGEYYLGLRTPVRVSGGATAPPAELNRALFGARLDVSWAPIYGKMSLLAEGVLHFDAYITGSVGVVGPQEGSPGLGWGFSVGQHYFLKSWFALRLDLRTQFFQMARNPDVSPKKDLQLLMGATVSACFFLPPDFEREKL